MVSDWVSAKGLFGGFGSLLANIPAPASQGLDDFGRHGGCERDSEEDEALVHCVCDCELCPYTFQRISMNGSELFDNERGTY